MKALTLHRPWPWAICHLGKRVENRTWRPPESVIGQDIAIHAGRQSSGLPWRGMVAARAAVRHLQPPGDNGPEGIVAIVRVQGWLRHDGARSRDDFEEVARVHGTDVADIVRSPWWFGPVGWILTDVRPIATPVPCKGAQGLWTVPPRIESIVLAQLA